MDWHYLQERRIRLSCFLGWKLSKGKDGYWTLTNPSGRAQIASRERSVVIQRMPDFDTCESYREKLLAKLLEDGWKFCFDGGLKDEHTGESFVDVTCWHNVDVTCWHNSVDSLEIGNHRTGRDSKHSEAFLQATNAVVASFYTDGILNLVRAS